MIPMNYGHSPPSSRPPPAGRRESSSSNTSLLRRSGAPPGSAPSFSVGIGDDAEVAESKMGEGGAAAADTAAAAASVSNNARGEGGEETEEAEEDIVRVVEDNLYRDHSHVTPAMVAASGGPSHRRSDSTFPARLHQMLSDPGTVGVVEWLPHGRSWRVVCGEKLESQRGRDLLLAYFSHDRPSSFMRQVNGWGFRRVMRGRDANSYYHELFLRGMPHLCCRMTRVSNKKSDQQELSSSPRSMYAQLRGFAPDFYRMSEEHPLPPTTATAAPLGNPPENASAASALPPPAAAAAPAGHQAGDEGTEDRGVETSGPNNAAAIASHPQALSAEVAARVLSLSSGNTTATRGGGTLLTADPSPPVTSSSLLSAANALSLPAVPLDPQGLHGILLAQLITAAPPSGTSVTVPSLGSTTPTATTSAGSQPLLTPPTTTAAAGVLQNYRQAILLSEQLRLQQQQQQQREEQERQRQQQRLVALVTASMTVTSATEPATPTLVQSSQSQSTIPTALTPEIIRQLALQSALIGRQGGSTAAMAPLSPPPPSHTTTLNTASAPSEVQQQLLLLQLQQQAQARAQQQQQARQLQETTAAIRGIATLLAQQQQQQQGSVGSAVVPSVPGIQEAMLLQRLGDRNSLIEGLRSIALGAQNPAPLPPSSGSSNDEEKDDPVQDQQG